MANDQNELRMQLNAFRFAHGILEEIPCSEQENAALNTLLKQGGTLPEGTYAYDKEYENEADAFYKVRKTELSAEEQQELLTYKQLALLKTIKYCSLFFVWLTILGFVASLILLLASL